MEIRNLLPIGTIVLLKEAQKKLMIHGVKQTDKKTGIEYDYIGVLYPEGNVSEEMMFLFNDEHIEEIIFRGYEDEERDKFIENLAIYYGQ